MYKATASAVAFVICVHVEAISRIARNDCEISGGIEKRAKGRYNGEKAVDFVKKILVFLLIVLILGLSACGNKAPEQPTQAAMDPVGLWQGKIRVDGTAMGVQDFPGVLELGFSLDFRENGELHLQIDREGLEASVAGFEEELAQYLVDQLYEQMGGGDAAEAAVLESAGMSCRDYAKKIVADMDLTATVFDSLDGASADSRWSMDEAELRIDEELVQCQIQGERMLLSGEGALFEALGTLGQEGLELTRI